MPMVVMMVVAGASFAVLAASEDVKEGLQSFLERREARFAGTAAPNTCAAQTAPVAESAR